MLLTAKLISSNLLSHITSYIGQVTNNVQFLGLETKGTIVERTLILGSLQRASAKHVALTSKGRKTINTTSKGARSAHVMNAGKHLIMERHKKAQHTDSFKCELCRKTLVERRNLVCHQASAHK